MAGDISSAIDALLKSELSRFFSVIPAQAVSYGSCDISAGIQISLPNRSRATFKQHCFFSVKWFKTCLSLTLIDQYG